METVIYKELSYDIIGISMEVHNNLGAGFAEIVYKDALEIEFENAGISFMREKKYEVHYKGKILPHHFYADFVIENKVILEIKSVPSIIDQFIAQGLNYLKVSNNKLALIVNFGETKLNFKRIVL